MSSWDDILTEQLTHDISIDQQQLCGRSLTARHPAEHDAAGARAMAGADGRERRTFSPATRAWPGARARVPGGALLAARRRRREGFLCTRARGRIAMAGRRGRIAVVLLVSAVIAWGWAGPWPVSAAGKQLVVSQ